MDLTMDKEKDFPLAYARRNSSVFLYTAPKKREQSPPVDEVELNKDCVKKPKGSVR